MGRKRKIRKELRQFAAELDRLREEYVTNVDKIFANNLDSYYLTTDCKHDDPYIFNQLVQIVQHAGYAKVADSVAARLKYLNNRREVSFE